MAIFVTKFSPGGLKIVSKAPLALPDRLTTSLPTMPFRVPVPLRVAPVVPSYSLLLAVMPLMVSGFWVMVRLADT